jgi:hypothetical protein
MTELVVTFCPMVYGFAAPLWFVTWDGDTYCYHFWRAG